MKKLLLNKLLADRDRGLTITSLATKIGLPYTTMHRILSGKNGNIANWEKIEAYYRKGTKKVSA